MSVTGTPLKLASAKKNAPIPAETRAIFAMNQTVGSTAWPYFWRPARVRTCCTMSPTMAMRPISRVTTSIWSGPISNGRSMNPLPRARYSSGNEPMFELPSVMSASPLKMSMPARVTMKAGMPTYAIQKPCQAPTIRPMTRAPMIASHQGKPRSRINTPEIAPMKAAIEPTDRSMCPATMTRTMPMASTRM